LKMKWNEKSENSVWKWICHQKRDKLFKK
jgi:hypothetical protein